jgi:hypothetical protein
VPVTDWECEGEGEPLALIEPSGDGEPDTEGVGVVLLLEQALEV